MGTRVADSLLLLLDQLRANPGGRGCVGDFAACQLSATDIFVFSGSRSRPALVPTKLASALRPDGLLLP